MIYQARRVVIWIVCTRSRLAFCLAAAPVRMACRIYTIPAHCTIRSEYGMPETYMGFHAFINLFGFETTIPRTVFLFPMVGSLSSVQFS